MRYLPPLVGRGVATLLVIGLLLGSRLAHAHSVAAQRSITAQVEDDRVVLLVTWTAPTGFLGPLMMASAALLSPKDPKEALTEYMAAHALRPISVVADGDPLEAMSMRRKLTVDASPRRRHSVSILLEYPLPRARTLVVRAPSPDPTRLAWSSKARQRQVHAKDRPAGRWGRGELTLEIR